MEATKSHPRTHTGSRWKRVLADTKEGIQADRLPLVAAAVAFYATLALIPGLAALVSVYALLNDPSAIAKQLEPLTSILPGSAATLVSDYLQQAAQSAPTTLGWGVALGVLGALWSASSGTTALLKAINIAYADDARRGFLALRGLALMLTLAFIVAGIIALALIAFVPPVLARIDLPAFVQSLIEIGRWPVLALGMFGLLAVLYRRGPVRARPDWRWIRWGSGIATAGWIVASLGFSYYVSHFGTFGETYGPLAGFIVLMLWLYLSSFLVLLGAKLNAELEANSA